MTKPPTRIVALGIETDMFDPKGMIEERRAFLLSLKRYRIERQPHLDYVVLRPWLQGTTVIERTVDLFALLRAYTKHHSGLKPHSVCRSLLCEGKLDLGTDAFHCLARRQTRPHPPPGTISQERNRP
jgi:hypothetical protein